MKTLYGLLIIAGAVALAAWGLPKLLASQSPAASGAAAGASVKAAVEETKQAATDIQTSVDAGEVAATGRDIPWYAYTAPGYVFDQASQVYEDYFGDDAP
jgi:hypothetical protein